MEGYLTQKFGKEDKTCFSGNKLDRVSYLREDTDFLHQALHSPDTRFFVLCDKNILMRDGKTIAWLDLSPVKQIIGDQYCVSQEDKIKNFEYKRDSPGHSYSQLVFLGLDHSSKSTFKYREYNGAPRFAIDATKRAQAEPELAAKLDELYTYIKSLEHEGVKLDNERNYWSTFDREDLSIVAQARTVVDWIAKTRFCAGCGQHVLSTWGGYKLACPDSLNKKCDCASLHQVCNFGFPRTDCCVIAAVSSYDGKNVLVGRSARFPGNMYSCLAGFLEGGESIEDCVRREIYEEAGVKIGRVVIHGSQPWPYPANVMIGCLAEVADASPESHGIYLEHDKELADAKWVPKEKMKELVEKITDEELSVPSDYAIAWNLLRAVSHL